MDNKATEQSKAEQYKQILAGFLLAGMAGPTYESFDRAAKSGTFPPSELKALGDQILAKGARGGSNAVFSIGVKELPGNKKKGTEGGVFFEISGPFKPLIAGRNKLTQLLDNADKIREYMTAHPEVN